MPVISHQIGRHRWSRKPYRSDPRIMCLLVSKGLRLLEDIATSVVDGEGWSAVCKRDKVALPRAGEAQELRLQGYFIFLPKGGYRLQMVCFTDAQICTEPFVTY